MCSKHCSLLYLNLVFFFSELITRKEVSILVDILQPPGLDLDPMEARIFDLHLSPVSQPFLLRHVMLYSMVFL